MLLCGQECFLSYEITDTVHPGSNHTTRGLCRRMRRTDSVENVAVMIMFARLLGQNIMSHAIWSVVGGCTVSISTGLKYINTSSQSVGQPVQPFGPDLNRTLGWIIMKQH